MTKCLGWSSNWSLERRARAFTAAFALGLSSL